MLFWHQLPITCIIVSYKYASLPIIFENDCKHTSMEIQIEIFAIYSLHAHINKCLHVRMCVRGASVQVSIELRRAQNNRKVDDPCVVV